MRTRVVTRNAAPDSPESSEWIAPSPRQASSVASAHRRDYSFGRMGVTGIAASRGTRNPTDEDAGGEVVTQSDAGVPGGAPEPAPAPEPAKAADNCSVRSGPSYTPSGTVPVTTTGDKKKARFTLAAAFDTDAGTGKKPSCCEVRQFIKWDKAFHDWMGGPPHSGFPSGAAADTWIEDRDKADTRYGHRSGAHSSPVANCGDEYKTGKNQDMANGDTYCGRDSPNGPKDMKGQFQFRLDGIDTCNGGATKASSSVITINWGS